MKTVINDFTEQLKIGLGSNLLSVILYGSVVSGEYAKLYSDANLLIVLEKTDLNILDIAASIKKKTKFKRINLLIFTLECLKGSTDTFPMEFLDIKDRYEVLYGEDYFAGMKIGLLNLRHQCEWELKSKILQMQKFYISFRGKDKALAEFLIKHMPSFMVIFRNTLRLKNISTTDNLEVLNRICQEFDLGKDFLYNLWQARISNSKINNPRQAFKELLSILEILSGAVDSLPVKADD